MALSLASPQDIYSAILGEVKKLIDSFSNYSGDEEIKKAQAEAQDQLKNLQKTIDDSLNQLQANSEWDVFTLAFYGETNAGKSTLIETLRILLHEPGKMQERETFSETLVQYHTLQKDMEERRSSIDSIVSEYKGKFTDLDNQLLELSSALEQAAHQIQRAENEAAALTGIIKQEKSSSFLKFLKGVFGKLPEQKKLKEIKSLLHEREREKDTYVKQQDQVNQKKEALTQELEAKTKTLNLELAALQERVEPCTEKLIAHADGKIIGDGRSDFTLGVTSYEFERGDQKFTLLDMPGIEGNEELVLDPINSAVQKAHAVFYVTSQPRPPQTGDKNSEGTIDKIKKHLGQQTEVYTIFNKRANNPHQLKDPLVNADELESLTILDKTMLDYLGEQYRQCIAVSAYPAFLAVGNCWGEMYLPKKEKFLQHFNTPEILLETSRIKTFAEQITGDIVSNSKAKIKKSNFKKAAVVLGHTTEETTTIHQNFLAFQQKLMETKKLTDDQLDNASGELKEGLDREAHTALETFKNNVRKGIYEDIDTDIDNKEFKSALESRSKEGIQELQNILEKSFKNQIDKFQENVSDIVKKYQDYASELLNAYSGAEQFNGEFNLNIDIKSGVNLVGTAVSVTASIAGVILSIVALTVSTAGAGAIVALVLSAIGAIVSIGKAIAGFFNHNYRKSQQRKEADKVLEKSGEDIYTSIKKNLSDCYEPLKAGIGNVKNELTKTVDHVKEINRILEQTITEFKTMTKTIVQEGDR